MFFEKEITENSQLKKQSFYSLEEKKIWYFGNWVKKILVPQRWKTMLGQVSPIRAGAGCINIKQSVK